MPKLIYRDFNFGGIADNDRQGRSQSVDQNTTIIPMMSVGRDVDVYGLKGYMRPTAVGNGINLVSGYNSGAIDIVEDPINGIAYIFILSRLLRLTSTNITPAFDTNIDGASADHLTLASLSDAKGIFYNISGTNAIMWVWRDGTSSFIGKWTGGAASMTAANGYSSNYSPASGTLSTGAGGDNVDIIEWGGNIYIASGRYIDVYSGSTDTMYSAGGSGGGLFSFDLSFGWKARCLAKTSNYYIVFARKSTATPSQCRAYLIDGSSSTLAVNIIELDGVDDVYAARNILGTVHFWSNNRDGSLSHCVLTDNGFKVIRNYQQMELSSTAGSVSPVLSTNKSSVESLHGLALFGSSGGSDGAAVYAYNELNDVLSIYASPSIHYAGASVDGGAINSIRVIADKRLLVAYFDKASATNKISYYDYLSTSYSTAGVYKATYHDFPYLVKLNYIEYFYKPLVLADSMTPGIDIDYGTSIGLLDRRGNATISYANDFRALVGKFPGGDPNSYNTKKRFDLQKINCHSVRPSLQWTAGGTPIYQIVIDYDPLKDDN